MDEHVCPWWLAYTFDNALRRLIYKPEAILAPYLKPGMAALDLGCGMGFFSIGMATLVEDSGHVIAVDLQQKMLDVLMKRAARAGVAHRIHSHCCTSGSIGTHAPVDFALACYMVHEVPDRKRFLEQVRACLKPEGRFLIMEPKFHVTRQAFAVTLDTAGAAGLSLVDSPRIAVSHAALFANAAPCV